MAITQRNESVPHSKYYWALIAAAIVIGVVGIYVILGVLVGYLGFKFGLRALAIALMFFTIGAARAIDEKILANSPHLVRPKDRQLLAERLGRDPLTGIPLAAGNDPASGYGQAQGHGPVPAYGQVPSYNQVLAPGQPMPPAQPTASTQTQPSAHGYGVGGYGPTAS
ncbi:MULTISPECIES: hypothetical protein [Actinomyces]|uniref:Uncharacterized protein n=1 Tax=Actinomyces glycerinitolerans TaxID=1892869 RepID=A0A1M4S005_9ACTO|nr:MULTISPECIES: hypothetical protein [Actinomyces]RAX20187.1 hypothetical protein DRB06_09425 [Actinomyces sp. Z5]RAX24336.1 hypothetical protein DRB07_01090 [Actinomyces sp. Z3]SHE25317.1 Hypothetical protein ACGLYG10_1533 [Actinomyces glycerinitolerans]